MKYDDMAVAGEAQVYFYDLAACLRCTTDGLEALQIISVIKAEVFTLSGTPFHLKPRCAATW